MRPTLAIALLALAACGGPLPQAHLAGRVDVASFGATSATVQATSDEGDLATATPGADGAFTLALPLGHAWTLAVVAGQESHPVAIARQGHFDRGFDAQGPASEQLGRLWLPPPGTALKVLPQAEAGQCTDGATSSGEACVVDEAFVACADPPMRPLEDPTSLFLGAGTLAELPGASRGVRYAVTSLVPPPILFACTVTPPST